MCVIYFKTYKVDVDGEGLIHLDREIVDEIVSAQGGSAMNGLIAHCSILRERMDLATQDFDKMHPYKIDERVKVVTSMPGPDGSEVINAISVFYKNVQGLTLTIYSTGETFIV